MSKVGFRSIGETSRRYTIFLFGLAFLALGISIMTKAQLGISPVQSIAYVVYTRFSDRVTLGVMVLCWNCFQVLLQLPLLGKNFGWKQLIQIPLSFFLSGMVDATSAMLFWLAPDTLLARLLTMAAGVLVLGFAICVTVAAGVVMNAGEALVYVIAHKGGWKFSTVKEFSDITIVAVAALCSFIFFGQWRFDIIGIGTLVSASLTGFVVRFFNLWVKPAVERICIGRKEEWI